MFLLTNLEYLGCKENMHTKDLTYTTMQQSKQYHKKQQSKQKKIYTKKVKEKSFKQSVKSKNNKSFLDHQQEQKKSIEKKKRFSLDNNDYKIVQKKQKKNSLSQSHRSPIIIQKKYNSCKLVKKFKYNKQLMKETQTKEQQKKLQTNPSSINNFKEVNNNTNQTKFNNKKITEVTEEQFEYSIAKSKKYIKNRQIYGGGNKLKRHHQQQQDFSLPERKMTKSEIISSLKSKIIKKVKKDYPNLYDQQKKLLIAVILIQRLWRQKKVKNIISTFLSPRNTLVLKEFQPQIKKYESTVQNKNIQKSKQELLQTHQCVYKSNIDNNPLKMSNKTKNKFEQKVQRKYNYLNFQESHSEKFLTKRTEIIKTKSLSYLKKKQKYSYHQNISHKQFEIFKNGEQFQQQIQKSQKPYQQKKIIQQQYFLKEEQSKQKQQQYNLLIDDIVSRLIYDFVVQFNLFSQKNTHQAKIKNKTILGFQFNCETNNLYLSSLIGFIRIQYKQLTIKNLNKIIGVEPAFLLKYLRMETEFIEDKESNNSDQYSQQAVLSNNIYFQHQLLFQKQNLHLDEKYKNFTQSIIRIHNKLLYDSFVEMLDKQRIFGANGRPYPWQKQFRRNYRWIKQQQFDSIMSHVKNQILDLCLYKMGNLNKQSNYQDCQDQKIIQSVKQQYCQELHQWLTYKQEKLQIKLEISNSTFHFLLSQTLNELIQL